MAGFLCQTSKDEDILKISWMDEDIIYEVSSCQPTKPKGILLLQISNFIHDDTFNFESAVVLLGVGGVRCLFLDLHPP